MFTAPPQGIMLETKEQIGQHAERIYLRAVATKTMPLGNLTGITQAERDLLGAWMAQGANVEAPGPVELPGAPVPAAPTPAPTTPEAKAEALFTGLCASCHGLDGRAETDTAKALTPHPRAYVDGEWQKSVTDEQLAKVIVEGGAAVGKSPLMPANPDLASQPEVVQALVKRVRSFAPKP
ncbi:MAG: c-type cytochrome [Myxococcaceae bacterium]